MVCMGNICRSPMAQAVAQKMAVEAGLAKQLHFDSAGTHAHHTGERPDPRAETTLSSRGYDVKRIRSRRIASQDFERFDLILAMDSSNLTDLRRICPPPHLNKLHLFLDFADGITETEVPDPYYGNLAGFDRVLDLCEAGAGGLVKRWGSPNYTL